MKRGSIIFTVLLIFFILMSGSMEAFGKPISEKDRQKLADIAKSHYALTEMDGASVFKFKGQDILVVITEVKKTANTQRVGQVKAARLAGEFLQDASNKSLTVYEVSDASSYSFQDKASENSETAGKIVSDKISQDTDDFTTTEIQENFSDKIIQSSLTRVGHIEPLCKIGEIGQNTILAYFLIIEK